MKMRLILGAAALLLLTNCTTENTDMGRDAALTTTLDFHAEQGISRSYDSDLKWSWEATDALTAFQAEGEQYRNTLNYTEASHFRCEEFRYTTEEPATLHFIYPAEAEQQQGLLTAVQDGTWRPVAVATLHDVTVKQPLHGSFEVLSAALEVRVWSGDRKERRTVTKALLSSESDFVGQWTAQADWSYTQQLSGKEIEISGLQTETVVFNMPVVEEGFEKGFLTLTLTDSEGKTTSYEVPALNFKAGQRTILNIALMERGTFTCGTYNVQSSTSGEIGTKITESGWDFFGLSEDFSNITSNLGGYTFGTRSRSALSFWGSAPKDGLGFATKTATCSFLSEYVDEFDEEYGGLSDGANTSVDKGFRVYPVQLADGVVVDVIITHMNTYSSDGTGHIDCQHAQLKEVATYIANHKNGRPVIFMGDTNCRYTRHDFETYFWSIIRGAGLSYADPWVDQEWAGVYPTYPSKSLMVSDATGTNSETDIICSTTQNGEVVDKVIYINDPDATVQLKADSFLRDMDFGDLSDHKPIVVEFTWMRRL